MEGFERNNDGTLFTVFSCPDYAGKFSNYGAIIKIKKNFDVVPHVIYPAVTRVGTWITPESSLKSNIVFDDEDIKLKRRPITPPRQSKPK